MRKVLVIEDDINLQDLIAIHLKDLDCDITRCMDGQSGLDAALSESYDLIVLDIMLPEMDGLDVCRQIRMSQNHTPILMLTAKSEEIDKVLGLETGADDYMTKPFSVREFIARVKVIFRRSKRMSTAASKNGESVMRYGSLSIDVEKRKVTLENQRIELSPKEFELLVLLASNPGKSYNRQRILNLVWGYDF